MEPISALVLAIALVVGGYSLGVKEKPKETPKQSDIQQCVSACKSGVLSQYQWCECAKKPLWEKGK